MEVNRFFYLAIHFLPPVGCHNPPCVPQVPRPIAVHVPGVVGPGELKVFEIKMESDDVSEIALSVGLVPGSGSSDPGARFAALQYSSDGTLTHAGSTSSSSPPLSSAPPPTTTTKLAGFAKEDRVRVSIDRKRHTISLSKNGTFIAVVDNVVATGALRCRATLTNKGDRVRLIDPEDADARDRKAMLTNVEARHTSASPDAAARQELLTAGPALKQAVRSE